MGRSVIVILTLLSVCRSDVPKTESDYLLKFYNTLNGNDSWSDNWGLYEGQDTASKSSELQGQPPAKLEWNSEDSLIKINLTNVGLEGPVPVGIDALTELQSLILSNNEITLLADLSSNSKLEHLDVSLNSLKNYTGTFPKSLTTIIMRNNSVKMEISEVLKKILAIASDSDKLEELNLNDNKLSGSISSEDLLSKTTLKWLGLADNKLTGDLPSIRSGSWENLDISNNMFTGDFPAAFKVEEAKANPRCNMFNCESLTNEPVLYNVTECYCAERGKEAILDSDNSAIKCETCADGKMANKWVRFTFWGEEVTDYTCTTPSVGCVDCMFPRNCFQGSCVTGSTGPTCEICEKDYRIIGGKCEKCLESKTGQVPIAALVLIVILVVIVGYGVFLSGLNIVASTMIKQLFTYLQIYYLTLDIKAAWPTYWAELGDVFKLSMINSQAFDLECLTSMSTINLFYVHWSSAVLWPIIMTIVVLSVDKSYSQRIENYERSTEEHVRTKESMYLRDKQTGMRRIWIMFILIAFVPMTALSLRMYACDDWFPQTVTVTWGEKSDGSDIVKNQWFYDNSVSCNEPFLQGVNFLATMLLIVEFSVIVFLFLILFRIWRLFDPKDKQSSDLFGALYESFNERGLFCEPCLLLRKFILIITTQITYLPPTYVAGGNCLLSFAWLGLILIRQPYILAVEGGRLGFILNNWCNLFEIAASILIFLTQLYALINGIDSSLLNESQDGMVYTFLVLNAILVVVWMAMFILVLIKVTRTGIKDRRSKRSQRSLHRQASRQASMLHMNPGAKVTPVQSEVLAGIEDDAREDSSSNLVRRIEETDM